MKEQPDRYGNDIVWFLPKVGSNTWEMWRCQLKLGLSDMPYKEGVQIIDDLVAGFTSGDAEALRVAMGFEVLELRLAVAVTRDLRPNREKDSVYDYAKMKGVDIWNKDYLIDHVWAKGVKDWAKKKNLPQYYLSGSKGSAGGATTATAATATTTTTTTRKVRSAATPAPKPPARNPQSTSARGQAPSRHSAPTSNKKGTFSKLDKQKT